MQTTQNPHNHSPVVLVHGLFGNLDNLGVLARELVSDRDIVRLDLRNHGLSPHSPQMNYPVMAQDLLDTLDRLRIDQATFIGHSMGGKAIMTLTALAPERIDQLVVLDITPVDYNTRRHDKIFTALKAVGEAGVTSRQQAAEIMHEYLSEKGVIQFLLKSFVAGKWRFNVPVIEDQYPDIVGWHNLPPWDKPVLFIGGGNSPWVTRDYHPPLRAQFPRSHLHLIAGAGHWIHAEKPQAVLRAIRHYLTSEGGLLTSAGTL